MAAKVLRALAAVLVGGAAKAGNLKERIVGHTEELLMPVFFRRLLLGRVRSSIEERTDGEDSILIDFCSFASGRLAIHTPYMYRSSYYSE